ncbi:MAG: AAA family ATPase [Candidatus Bathyarchaeia archaeon]
MSAAEELERLAAKYAGDAVSMEREGSYQQALPKYQRAVEILLKLSSLYPNTPQKKIYMSRVRLYRSRIEELKSGKDPNAKLERIDRDIKVNFDQFIITEKQNVRWSDIADLKDAKKAIEEAIVFPIKRPDLFTLGWPRGILFYGPPGCGKTLLASAVATEIDAVFYYVDSASLMSKWLGESEKNVAKLFSEAREAASKGQPVIIFVDEIDSILGKRLSEIGGEVRTRNQFLKEMDGILDKTKSIHLYVIGATNKPWDLDEAFIRRFQRRIFVPLPEYEARLEIFKIHSRNLRLSGDVRLDELANLTEGYSGSDIRDIVQTAHIRVIREFFENGDPEDRRSGPRAITQRDFLEMIERRRPSVSTKNMSLFRSWSNQFNAV